MRQLFPILFISLFGLNSQAIHIQVVGKNGILLYQNEVTLELPTHVGEATVQAFNRDHVPYEGTVHGIKQIYDLKQDIEIISDTEMKAYGWCFSIDGETPDTMPDQTAITNQNSHIRWYYAYARYKDGDWVGTMCTEDQ